ncbi:hypothetical protein [Butyrivibrio sp. VCB2001]|uniref:hypothetical protein n=1 Tax=Butyrivibrio sp. VCB2001 TaxID=1280667 RepID=UPI00042839E9|nr:hypothetical protein [Butyrivibrio sp. VCB2001]
MFNSLVYFNKKKIDQYSALICGKMIESNITEEIADYNREVNYLLECKGFEELLKQSDDYVDYVDNNNDLSVKDIRVSSILRFTAEMYIPERFDMIHLVNEYKSLLLGETQIDDSEERKLLETVIKNSKMTIPLFCEMGSICDYWLGIGKAIPDNLLVDYNELEDYEGKEVTIIAKLESRKHYKDRPLPVFDIYKDFLGLNRAIRKQIASERKQDFECIEVEEDFLELELLAIYA